MKCTIQSIADELELSRNTVARVLSGKDGVSAKTRKLVLRKAAEMGYGETAPSLPKKQPPQIPESIVLLTSSSSGSPEARAAVIQAAEEYIQKKNFNLILAVTDKDSFTKNSADSSSSLKKEPQLPAVLYSPSVRGVIMMDIDNEDIYHEVFTLDLPAAVINSCGQNHTQIRFLESNSGKIDLLSADLIQDKNQLAALLTNKKTASVTFVSSQEKLSQLLDMKPFPDFFLCEDDWTAIRLIHAAQSSGYSVPQDFSVIGCGNIPESAHVFPSLTTMAIPWQQIGKTAARCIIDRIMDPNLSCVSVNFTSRLIERSSAVISSKHA